MCGILITTEQAGTICAKLKTLLEDMNKLWVWVASSGNGQEMLSERNSGDRVDVFEERGPAGSPEQHGRSEEGAVCWGRPALCPAPRRPRAAVCGAGSGASAQGCVNAHGDGHGTLGRAVTGRLARLGSVAGALIRF